MPFEALQRAPLAGAIAGGTSPRSLFSVASNALLPYFTTREACVLRSVCQELRSTVADFPWQDAVTPILGSLACWRSSFPRARAANVALRDLDNDQDWVHLAGHGCLTELVAVCSSGMTDTRLALLSGLQRLDARACKEITAHGLTSLPHLQWADLQGCQLEEEDLPLESDLVLGSVDWCTYCHCAILHDYTASAACSREPMSAFNGVTCRAEQEEGGSYAVCCDACIARRGCHVCSALECKLCSEEQYEEVGGDWGDTCVGRGIARCAMCSRHVCGTRFGNECGGVCVVCSRQLCKACGELQDTACNTCLDTESRAMEESERECCTDITVCGKCRMDRGVVCLLRAEGCEADAWEEHQRKVAAQAKASVSRKRKWGYRF